MQHSTNIRKIREEELPSLYRHLHLNDPELAVSAEVKQLWQRILSDPKLNYLVADVGGRIVSTCTLVIVLNLTRGARPYGLIENVVTDPEFRRQGIGTRILQAALAVA